MVKSRKLLYISGLIFMSCALAHPVYAEKTTPETVQETDVDEQNDDNQTDESNNADESTDADTSTEFDITEITDRITITDATIASFNSLKENGLEASGYNELQVGNASDINTGDIMIKNDEVYICMKINSKTTFWKMEDDSMKYQSDIEYDVADSVIFHKTTTQMAYPIIKGLIGYPGNKLSLVVLPQNYEWLNADTDITGLGKTEYPALYMPEDFLNDKAAIILIEVEIKPHSGGATFGKNYTVKYVPHLTAESVGIPEGWKINNKEELKIGNNTVSISYKFPDGTIDSETVTVTVEKGEMNIPGVMITVVENTKIDDNILPKISNGTLQFGENVGKVITQNTILHCTFVPDDVEKYNNTYDIPVIFNVVPQSIIQHIQPSKEEDSQTDNKKDNEQTEDNDKKQADDTPDKTSDADKEKDTTSDSKNEKKDSTTNNKTDDNTDSNKKTIDVNSDSSNQNKTNTTTNITTNTTNNKNTVAKNDTSNTDKTNTTEKKTETNDINLTSTTGEQKESKVQMKDIDLTKKTTDNKETVKNQSDSDIKVETIDLKKHTNTDAEKVDTIDLIKDNKEKETSTDATEEVTEEKETTTEKSMEANDNKPKEEKSSSVKLMLIIGLLAAIFAGCGIVVFKTLRKNKFK